MESMEPTIYKSFWDKFSTCPNMDTMMLNTSADEVEPLDRYNILSSLPNYTGMDIADIGAGIGRFTSSLAERARHVIASDFIESFIMENRKRNAHLNNIIYKVADTTSLQLSPKRLSSLDLVFTNWLLMYLNDDGTIKFLLNTLHWLRFGGYLHLRESCSEPSTGHAKTVSMHKSSNPTRYRLSSVYIELMETIRYVDENGEEWRFNIEWAESVPTYIERQSNWRQVHWLARKTLVKNSLALEFPSRFTSIFKNIDENALSKNDSILNKSKSLNQINNLMIKKLIIKMKEDWPFKQWNWDAKLDGERYGWTDTIFKSMLDTTMIVKSSTMFCYNPRRAGNYTYVNAHALADNFACNVWSVETNSYLYRVSLTKANELKDQRVRFAWSNNLKSALNFWNNKSKNLLRRFNGFFSIELFAEIRTANDFKRIANILDHGAFFITLEAVKGHDDEIVEELVTKIKMLEQHFKLISVFEITEMAEDLMQQYFSAKKNKKKLNGFRWLLIKAQIVKNLS